ncbi:hypothetical protein AAVH_13290 [Aphelenchoides avenae]|nr:hypothetical protein AAVH_13290 [Aphelenchus avenae]
MEFGLFLALLLLHMSMVGFIVAHGRRDRDFRQPSSLSTPLYASPTACEWLGIGDTTEQIDDAFGIILPCAQAMLHLLIAANRFTAFFFPLSHSSIWNKRRTFVPILSVVVLSISVYVGTIYGLRLFPDDGTSGEPWNNFAYFYVPVCAELSSH